MKKIISDILFGLFWLLPLFILMLETKWGKRPMVDERDRLADTLFSWGCAGLGLCFFAAVIFG